MYFCVILLISLFICAVTNLQHASYTKTTILNTNCDPSTLLRTEIFTRRTRCALLCSDEVECRRYQYCSTDLSCKLFVDGSNCVKSGDSTGCSCYKKNIGCNDGSCTCPWGYYGSNCENIITDCLHGKNLGMYHANDIITNIKPVLSPTPFEVLCRFGFGGWTIVLYRTNTCNSGTFNRSLLEYETGFGNHRLMNGWIGLEKMLYLLGGPNIQKKLAVNVNKEDGWFCVNHYNGFSLGSKAESYQFHSTSFSLAYPAGGCGNSFTGSINLEGKPFSTYDADFTGTFDCANRFGGGWWFSDVDSACTSSFLTGTTDGSGTDVMWLETLGDIVIPDLILTLQ